MPIELPLRHAVRTPRRAMIDRAMIEPPYSARQTHWDETDVERPENPGQVWLESEADAGRR